MNTTNVNIGLNLLALRAANIARQQVFTNAKGENIKATTPEWLLSQWVNATAGEAGELAEMVLMAAVTKSLGTIANAVKKVERGDFDLDHVRELIGKESADVLIYLDLLCDRAGISLSDATIAKWNEVSRRIGCDLRLEGGVNGFPATE